METLDPLIWQVLEKNEVLEQDQKVETEKTLPRYYGSEIGRHDLLNIFNRWHTSRKILQDFHHG